jgi:hypothetical protein
MGVKSKGEQVRQAQVNGAENLGKFGKFEVIKVTTPEAGAKLFRDTEWCVKDPAYFNDYGAPFYLFLLNGEKFALLNINDGFQFKDVFDDDIAPSDHLKNAITSMIKAGALVFDADTLSGAIWYVNADPMLAAIALKDPQCAAEYAMSVLEQRWPEAEPIILQHPGTTAIEYAAKFHFRWSALERLLTKSAIWKQQGRFITLYAKQVIGGRWDDGEWALLDFGDPWSCAEYAADIIKGPWPEAEQLIATNAQASKVYSSNVLHGRFLAGEPIIARTPDEAYGYACFILKGRWPEAEPYIIKDARAAVLYAISVIKGPWPEAEPTIKADHHQWDIYCSRFGIRPEGTFTLYGPFCDRGDAENPPDGSGRLVRSLGGVGRAVSDALYDVLSEQYEGEEWESESETVWDECKDAGREIGQELADSAGEVISVECNGTEWFFVLHDDSTL